ncbi:MAG: redox-regulated ATPase YchF [Verrucomicrobia bacterium]|nr:redox-regulated ATPase YchF [Verrucomicrobiota bacterium]
MKVGLVGLPNSGKTTVFNLLTGQQLAVEPYFTEEHTVHLGTAHVPDARVDFLHTFHPRAKRTYAEVVFVDMAGVPVGGAGHGSKAQLFSCVRDTEALVYVVGAFDNESVLRPFDTVDPVRDIETLDLELMLADLEIIDKRIERIHKELQAFKDKYSPELDVLVRCKAAIEAERPIRRLGLSADEAKLLGGFRFLSEKPSVVLLNTGESDAGRPVPEAVAAACAGRDLPVFAMSAKIEGEITGLPDDEQRAFLDELGIAESGLPKFVHAVYSALGLRTFLTMGDTDVRAWTVSKGATALEAAGKIHTDIARGFIRAEVTAFEDIKAAGSPKTAKEAGHLRLEGKEYVVRDGDVILFRFSV